MKKCILIVTIVVLSVSFLMNASNTFAASSKWQEEYPEITLGVITSENEADRVERYKPVRAYLERALGVKVNWRSATDYAGIIEAMKLSFMGCLKNILPFLIYGIVGFVLMVIATIPFGLGWLILAPVVLATVYVGYKDIFLE